MILKDVSLHRWAIKFRSKNKLDGTREYFVFKDGLPVLFTVRAEARQYIKDKYGYLKHRKDLREEPFGWKMPEAVQVIVHISEYF